MKKIAMFALIVTALVTASTAFARPCVYGCRGYYGGGYYYGVYGYYYGGPRLVNGVACLVDAGLNLAADIVTIPLRGVAYRPVPAVCPAAPVVHPVAPAPTVYNYPTVTYRPAPAVYSYPTVTYSPTPVVYAPRYAW